MRLAEEKGIALVLSLFLMTAMSVLGASLMFLSQTETYSSMNYRLMSQARYGAEAGIHKAANYLIYPSSYTPPANGGRRSDRQLQHHRVAGDLRKRLCRYRPAGRVVRQQRQTVELSQRRRPGRISGCRSRARSMRARRPWPTPRMPP